MLSDAQRQRFDHVLERVITELPAELAALLERVPLVGDDEPSLSLQRRLGLNARTTELCGLHWGVPLTQRSVQHSHRLPDQMMLFRGPVMRMTQGGSEYLRNQVRITLLHEIGHHFGLSEDDLARLGYA